MARKAQAALGLRCSTARHAVVARAFIQHRVNVCSEQAAPLLQLYACTVFQPTPRTHCLTL